MSEGMGILDLAMNASVCRQGKNVASPDFAGKSTKSSRFLKTKSLSKILLLKTIRLIQSNPGKQYFLRNTS